jgi:chromosome segregation ATPase
VQHQAILDWYKLENYTAPAEVAQLATDTTMTPYARKVFYVNAPALEGKVEFKQCKIGGEQTIVLGCYHGNQNGIYVLNVTDPRLEGVEQVTSAHEMLHAAYDRLSSSERKKIDTQLRDYYNHQLTDERVRQTVENYRTFEPNELTNEMHSIFGTEVANLPAPLEQYYQRFFTDRSKVVAYAARYQAEFTTRQQAIKADDDKLTALKSQIDSLKADLTSREKQLDSDSARLQQLKAQGNVAAYNAGVPPFNASVNIYNAEVQQTRSLISQYNDLVARRNAIVLEAQQLTNEIDSNVAPISEQ